MEDSELERFRKEWEEEVRAKADRKPTSSGSRTVSHAKSGSSSKGVPAKGKASNHGRTASEVADIPRATTEPKLKDFSKDDTPKTALELYELAVESESNGSLGHSVGLYRKAYRLDPAVDEQYKNKHFPPVAPPTTINEAPSSSQSAEPAAILPISELISSFADCRISTKPPIIEGDIPPPCPIAQLPSEILIEVLGMLAEMDVASFAKSAQVCKRFAFIVSTEESIWKQVLFGEKFGMAGQILKFKCGILGDELPLDHRLGSSSEEPEPDIEKDELRPDYNALYSSLYASSYRQMYHQHPRVRFSGMYISTVNYIRPGGVSATQVSWNTPIHIITYYRYLRFFRDGTVLSLLTVEEPATVVPIFTRDQPMGKDVASTNPLHNVLRGRWRLAPPSEAHAYLPSTDLKIDPSTTPLDEVEVETEGPVGGIDKYIYKLRLSIRGLSKSNRAKSTRLVWRGFWSYNQVSDDWSVFGLRNDRQFAWVKVGAWRDE